MPGLAITAVKRTGLSLVVVAMLAMWIYALVFSPRESINKIGDGAWADRAELLCISAKEEINELADYRLITSDSDLAERASLVKQATSILRVMVSRIANEEPTDDKGQAIVPLWLADYQTYLSDRDDYAALLEKGTNAPFAETQVDGLPLSEKITTFANDNRMPACSPPRDLSV